MSGRPGCSGRGASMSGQACGQTAGRDFIEKCAPACAASGKPGGFLALDWCDSTPALSSLARASFALHRRLADALGGADAYGFRPVHTLYVLVPQSRLRLLAAAPPAAPDLGGRLRVRGPAEVARDPDTTAQVHPTKAALAASGAEVVISEVERVVARDGHVAGVVVKGRDDVVDADAVVLVLGPWSGRLEVICEVFDVATGHSCWGILNGPATGAALAVLILDGKVKIVGQAFQPGKVSQEEQQAWSLTA